MEDKDKQDVQNWISASKERTRRWIGTLLGQASTDAEDFRTFLLSMHDTAGKYHVHFSAMRTGTSAFLAPLIVGGSLAAYADLPDWKWWIFLTALALSGVLFVLNMVFSSWSKICRDMEYTYEHLFAKAAAADVADERCNLGFRNLFYRLQKGKWKGGADKPKK